MSAFARDPILTPVAIASLRPTQITVGMREVKKKREAFKDKGDKAGTFLGRHMIPVVLGPNKRHYILDHHHLALALQLDGIEHVLTSVVDDLSKLDKETFWFVLAHKNWMHI
ncbi:MAG TPA: ParB-like protein, partial [Bradyrhizobium sp.]